MLTTLTLLSLALLAQATPITTGSVSGQVTNAVTGKPISRATVQVVQPSTNTRIHAVTDAGGHFEFPALGAGEWIVTALRAGFGIQANLYPQTGSGHLKILLAAGAKVTGVELRLKPESIVAGRVVAEDGEPLEDVLVQLVHLVYVDGRWRIEQVRLAYDTTNDRGEYRIYGIMPGLYCLVAIGARDGAAFDRAGPVYYPAAWDPAAARRFDIRPGMELRGMDFVLLPARLVRLRGRVFDANTGKPPANTTLTLSPAGSTDTGTVSRRYNLGRSGDFELTDVRVGSYTILAEAAGPSGTRLASQINVSVGDANIDNLELPLTTPPELAGSVRLDGEQGRSDFNPARLAVGLRSRQTNVSSSRGKVDAKGAFAFRNILPVAYDVSLIGLPDSFYLKSVRFEDKEVIDKGLEVRGAGKFDLTLLVSGDAAQVEGTVKDRNEKPAAGATVVLVPSESALRSTPWRYKDTTAAHDGTFSLKGIAPGAYQLYAWDEIEPGTWFDAGFLKTFEADATTVSFEPQDRKAVTLRLPPLQEKREGREP